MNLLKNVLQNNKIQRGYSESIPFGWYFIAFADQLKKGDINVISCFGNEWVLFRNKKNVLGMLEPYCPHLGAHIGIGGKVEGELIRCPFHAWGFDINGFCRNIPYAKNMPTVLSRRPALKSVPILERHKIIWGWYHPEGVEPLWSVDEIQEIASNNWTPFEEFEFEIDTSVQDITENSVDYAHLKYVHGHSTILKGITSYNGVQRNVNISGDVNLPNSDSSCHYSIDLNQNGPGQMTVHYHRGVDLLLLFLMTPVSHEKTILRFVFTHPNYPEGSTEYKSVKNLMIEKMGSRGHMSGVYADIPIWNNKIFRKTPLLCDGDGPIMQFRSWFQQFYA